MENKNLNDKITLKNGSELKNRLFKSAMSEQLGDKDHNPTSKLVKLYKAWGDGGIGVSISGNVMIDRTALGEPRNVVLDDKSDADKFRSWTKAGTSNKTHFWAQLNHPGKQSPKFLSKSPVAPSAVSLRGGLKNAFNTPRELTEKEILEIIKKFATSAKFAKEYGFTGVQIHSAHGYLVNQFLSPHHNRREDGWGGSFEKRTRFVVEIYKAMRKKVGNDFPVSIKLNSSDFRDGGFTIEEAIKIAEILDKEGIDLIEISGGSYENPNMMGKPGDEKEGYFIEYAAKIKEKITAPLVLTGGFRSAKGMISALNSGATDMIGIARPLAVETDFPSKVLNDIDYKIYLPHLSTGIKALDSMVMIGLTWYEYQMYRIGKGKKVNPKQNAWSSALQTLWRVGVHAFKQRRA
ncbi:MAG: NADH:flavin oxidoreductase/NADH oxidase family protein [Desulfobacterales bacterium]|nr:NADH:flavin oxidoreductase/NADH oxidase family protein [Desulfobacterales bacterium]